ncbi:MAG TPA: DUF2252 family protein [Hydrogenophaga sp.]|uniref:DUF2252 domain-containing protein n=1 Tax=Hydrogenophaga sp. TaxID=1904254 RepID=UPI002C5C5CBC|nr:DUF2252 family protein [Hydrogenophaga sp.]HMN93850.1 DUF2252 family protein [Hydrogenophaga sp.]HMP09865.1 DUF2252 family protein [Hydrogenophaga sp.]
MGGLVQQILKFNAGRDPERVAMKYRNMRSGAFVFLRASCHLFYRDLPDVAVLRKAPAAWCCGDLHLENFGSYKGDNRLVYFDINDFDEGVLAPATWDAVRMLASVLVGRDSLRVDEAGAVALCRRFIDAYAEALAEGRARWIERETAEDPVRGLLDSLRERRRAEFLDRRTVKRGSRRRLRVDGRKALAATPEQHQAVAALIGRFSADWPDPGFFKVLDVARRIAGNGSLGLDRYVLLVQGKGSPDRNYLLDLKEAPSSALRKRTPLPQPHWRCEAERIIAIQSRMQAVSAAFLHAVTLGERSYVLRDLQPSEDRVALAVAEPDAARAERLVMTMGRLLAWAQLRSSGRQGSATADELMDFGGREGWRKKLMEAAQVSAETVQRDWAQYCEAYDDGLFPRVPA